MRSAIRRVFAVLKFGIRSHAGRPRHVILMIAGFAIAAVTVAFMLAIPAGLEQLAGATGRSDLAIVLQADASSEIGSALSPSIVAIVSNLPGVARDKSGKPEVAPQYLASTQLRASDGATVTAQLRGVTEATWDLLGVDAAPILPIDFNPNSRQLLAGQDVAETLPSARPGAQLKVREGLWRVSDFFAPGGMWNSELWSGISVLQTAFNSPNVVSVVWLKLSNPDALQQIEAAIENDRRLYAVRIQSQRAYYAGKVRVLSHYARIAALAVAFFLGLGAIIAIGNAVSLALEGRQRELATLRALGFNNTCLAIALFIEVVLVAISTTLVVIPLLQWFASGMHFATSTGDYSFGFQVAITPQVFAWVLGYTALLGIVSAILPSLHVLRAPLLRALARD